MSEAAPEGGTNSGETPAADEFQPITSQDDLNRIIGERVKRATAKFADYKELQAKAAKADEYEKANQTEAERSAARLAELEAELESTRRESLRMKIASAHGITDADDIDLFLTGTDEETLTRQAQRLADRDADRKNNGNFVPREGTNPKSENGSEEAAFARALLGSGDST
jgi:hypothetical protein